MSVENVNAAAGAAAGSASPAVPATAPVVAPVAPAPVIPAPAAPAARAAPPAAPSTQTTAAPPADTTVAPKVETDPADLLGAVEPSEDLATAAKIAEELKAKKEADEKTAADAEKAKADEAKKKADADAPVTFKPDLSLEMKDEDVTAWGDVLKSAGITSGQAQKLADELAKRRSDPAVKEAIAKAAADAKAAQLKKQVADDLVLSRALPNIGGANLETTIKASAQLLGKSKEGVAFSKMLKDKGLTANPAILGLLSWVNSQFADDKTAGRLGGNQPVPKPEVVPASVVEDVNAWSNVGRNSKKPQTTK